MLHEIIFRDFRGAKSAILTRFLHFMMADTYPIQKFRAPKKTRMAVFRTSAFPKVDFM